MANREFIAYAPVCGLQIPTEAIAVVQKRLDGLTPRQRRRLLREFLECKLEGLGLAPVLAYIALSQRVSVAAAAKMLTEKLADGSLPVTGIPAQHGVVTGPREVIPPHLFRGRAQ